jgi:hypothetical protein
VSVFVRFCPFVTNGILRHDSPAIYSVAMNEALPVGTLVKSAEHPHSIGVVMRQMKDGHAIEWRTPPSSLLPYGHIITEFWPFSDTSTLEVIPATITL